MDIAKSRNFLLKENTELDEMAKIQGNLKSAIEKVIADNPDANGLPLKKLIRADSAVQDALDGEDLYDNQLNKFITALKGEREVGPRGRKAGGSTDAKQDIDSEVSTGSAAKLSSIIEPEGEEEEEDIIDTWNTPEEEDTEIEREPSKRDIKKASAGLGIQDTNIDQANAFKNIITKKVDKIEPHPPNERAKSVDMGALKQFISKPEVVKALTVPTIRSLVSSIIG
jgi:hypothetical protein